MSAGFPEPLPSKPGYDLLKDPRLGAPLAGAIRAHRGATEYPVLAILKKKDEDIYIVVLTKNSDAPGYRRTNPIEYNWKAFSNENATNAFTVLEDQGPLQFKCTGPARLNL